MRKKLAILAIVAIALSLVAYGTLAYFSAEGTAHNVMTMGNVKIALADRTLNADQQEVDFNSLYPAGRGGAEVMPASTVSKIVYVTNTGDNPCWVRVKVDIDLQPDTLSLEPIEMNFDTDHWTEGQDGYWYYNEALESDLRTTDLFTEVHFDGYKTTDDYKGCSISINVSAEAVQADNNGETVMEAQGWPVQPSNQ